MSSLRIGRSTIKQSLRNRSTLREHPRTGRGSWEAVGTGEGLCSFHFRSPKVRGNHSRAQNWAGQGERGRAEDPTLSMKLNLWIRQRSPTLCQGWRLRCGFIHMHPVWIMADLDQFAFFVLTLSALNFLDAILHTGCRNTLSEP